MLLLFCVANAYLARFRQGRNNKFNQVRLLNPQKVGPSMEKTERKYIIRAFGIAKEIMGGREVAIETTAETAGDLRDFLEQEYPELNALKSFFIAVNNQYADDNLVLNPGDEIAVIPPVSGG